MRVIYFFGVLLFCQTAFSQGVEQHAINAEQEAINKDVWNNFMQAYQDLDASLFNQIHTEDIIRVAVDGNKILIGQEYKDQNLETFNRWNTQKVKQKIAFSFYNRIQKGDWAYEIGIYKLTRYQGSNTQSYYAKFNVTLKKISGVWKIHTDSDTNEGNTIEELLFQKGELLDY